MASPSTPALPPRLVFGRTQAVARDVAFVEAHHLGLRWCQSFERAKTAARRALGDKRQTATVLAIVLSRRYTLRNQLMHGGATWRSSVNRNQIRDGAAILADVVPRVIHLLIVNPEEDWGEPCYPVMRNDT